MLDSVALIEGEIRAILGPRRARITVPNGIAPEELEVAAMSDEKVVPFLQGKTIKKTIVLPGKLVNFVVG